MISAFKLDNCEDIRTYLLGNGISYLLLSLLSMIKLILIFLKINDLSTLTLLIYFMRFLSDLFFIIYGSIILYGNNFYCLREKSSIAIVSVIYWSLYIIDFIYMLYLVKILCKNLKRDEAEDTIELNRIDDENGETLCCVISDCDDVEF